MKLVNRKRLNTRIALLALSIIAAACATEAPPPPPPQPVAPPPPPPIAAPKPKPSASKVVKASYQGTATAGLPTASGEPYNPNAMTAASKTLPLGTVVKVTNPANGKSVNVRINDRGPFVPGRSLDLSKHAAEKLGVTEKGVVRLKVTPVAKHTPVEEVKKSSVDHDAARAHLTPVAAHPDRKPVAHEKDAAPSNITPVSEHPAVDGASAAPPVSAGSPASGAPATNPPTSD